MVVVNLIQLQGFRCYRVQLYPVFAELALPPPTMFGKLLATTPHFRITAAVNFNRIQGRECHRVQFDNILA